MNSEDSYLGRGWSFPPSFTRPIYNSTATAQKASGGVEMVTGLADIEQSLYILFSTRLGERVLAHDYGSDLDSALFEALNASTIAQIEFLVKDAVLYHEPRIEVLDVDVSPDPDQPNLVLVVLDFKVRNINSRHNYVYPFYLQEGSELNIPAAQ